MLNHHLQKQILNKLITAPTARYAELKPADIESNVFTYHLHQLIRDGLVEKCQDGSYCLTSSGKAAGITSKLSSSQLEQQAHAILLLLAIDDTKGWLLRKRIVHPLYGRTGFIHGEPRHDEPVTETAVRRFKQKTGLSASFTVSGSGYIRIYKQEELESFTQFTLLKAESITGTLLDKDTTGVNEWHKNPDLSDDSYIPSMKDLVALHGKDELFFADLTYHI